LAAFAHQGTYPAESVTPEALAAASTLPDLGNPTGSITVRPGPSGVTLEHQIERTKIIIAPEYSNQTGSSLGLTLATMLGDKAAVGVLLQAGAAKNEVLVNAGYRLDEHQRFVVTAGQLEQFMHYAFPTGEEKVGMKQNSGALHYQLQLGREFLRFLEINGYVADTASRELAGKTFSVDTATLYELWSTPRRIAGSTITGLQARLSFVPMAGSVVKVNLGQEHLRYDFFTGADSVNRLTGGLQWLQDLGDGYNLNVAADSFATQDRFTLGLQRSFAAGSAGRHTMGLGLVNLRGRDGLGNDEQVKLSYAYTFGANAGHTAAVNPAAREQKAAPGQSPVQRVDTTLLHQVAQRPSVIPSTIAAKVDTTVTPRRLIAVDKATLPAGASINPSTGDITAPLGVAVSGITDVTKNLATFANTGQFGLVGNSLVLTPSRMTEPAVGAVDRYVVTLANVGGGTTLVTVLASRGSVKIDSIAVTSGDATAPVTTAVPEVFGTTSLGTTLRVTINENGTGYYLVQAATANAPSPAAVQAGTSFAMAANVPATPAITGLTASTAYTVYFVAMDAAGNLQAVVQSVSVTTAVAPSAPTASSVAISGTAQVGLVLTGSYTYADANGDPQGASTLRWLRNGVAIAGATASTYTLEGADQGSTITFEATPVSTVAPTTGAAVTSNATAAVAGAGVAAAPTASSVAISGTAQVGQVLTGSYTYADANSDPQGTSTFRWLRSGVAIAGATGSTYTLVGADQGKTITFEVTPVSTVAPTIGTPVVSSATATVAAAPDVTPPAIPTLTATPGPYTNANSVAVEVNGEVGAVVWVNGSSTGATVAGSGKVAVSLDTSGGDGLKNFSITLQDAALNTSGALAVSVEKGTVPPTSVAWDNAGGYIPDLQGGLNSFIVLAGNKSFAGASGMAIASLAASCCAMPNGSIANLSIDGSGRLVFDYSTPFADPDTLRITGTDKYGNAILIDLVVPLPY